MPAPPLPITLAPGAAIDDDQLAEVVAQIAPRDRLGEAWPRTVTALRRLVDGEAYAAFAPAVQQIVATATLLHALGAAHVMPGSSFAAKSDTLARAAMYRAGVPFGLREHVCGLIRHHAVPARDLDDDNRTLALTRWLSLIVRHDWLCAMAHAIAPSDNILLWQILCETVGVFGRAQAFASEHTKVVYFEQPSRWGDWPAHDDTTCEVIAMCGLPAAGKNTWLAQHHPGLAVVSLDDLRDELDIDPADGQGAVIDAARSKARELLRTHASFAWNATNLTRLHRKLLVDLVRGYRGRVRFVYCEATATDQQQRNRDRAAVVPAQAVRRMIERWTVPDPSEAHAVTYVVPSTPDDVAWPPC